MSALRPYEADRIRRFMQWVVDEQDVEQFTDGRVVVTYPIDGMLDRLFAPALHPLYVEIGTDRLTINDCFGWFTVPFPETFDYLLEELEIEARRCGGVFTAANAYAAWNRVFGGAS